MPDKLSVYKFIVRDYVNYVDESRVSANNIDGWLLPVIDKLYVTVFNDIVLIN